MSILSVNCIAVALATAFILATAAVVIGVTTAFTDTAADDFAIRLTAAIANSGRSKVVDYVSLASGLELGTRWAHESGVFPVIRNNQSRGPALTAFLFSQLAPLYAAAGKLTHVGTAFDDGFWGYCTVASVAPWISVCGVVDPYNTNNASLPSHTTYTFIGKKLVSTQSVFQAYDPRDRSWYKDVLSQGTAVPNAVITEPYLFFLSDTFIASMSGPIINASSGGFIGTTFVGIDLQALSPFLNALPSTAGSVSALLDNQSFLLGISDLSPMYKIFNTSAGEAPASGAFRAGACSVGPRTFNTVCRYDASQSPNRLLAAAARDFAGAFAANVARSATAEVSRVRLAGKDHYVGVAGIALPGITWMGWKLVTVVPATDITGGIVEGRNVAIGVGAGSTIVAVLVCSLALFILLRPLRRLADHMYAAATLRSDALAGDTDAERASSVREVKAIADAFAALQSQLLRARSFLPSSLLAQLDANTEDGDDVFDDEGTCQTSGGENRSDSCERSRVNSRREHTPDDRSTTSRSHSHSVLATPVEVATLGEATMRRRAITVLAVNVRGFHKLVDGRPALLSAAYATLVDAVTDGAKQQRGVLDSFHGDRFMVTFNAAIGCASHASAAVAVGARLAERLEVPTTAGVATGPAHVGNMGSERTRRLNNVGAVVPQACVLERLCKAIPGASLLLTRGVVTDTQHMSQALFVDVVPLPGTGPTAVPIAALRRIHDVRASRSDEWMYELQATAGEAGTAAGVADALIQRVNELFTNLSGGGDVLSPATCAFLEDLQGQLQQLRSDINTLRVEPAEEPTHPSLAADASPGIVNEKALQCKATAALLESSVAAIGRLAHHGDPSIPTSPTHNDVPAPTVNMLTPSRWTLNKGNNQGGSSSGHWGLYYDTCVLGFGLPSQRADHHANPSAAERFVRI